jgi:hypothetical protein
MIWTVASSSSRRPLSLLAFWRPQELSLLVGAFMLVLAGMFAVGRLAVFAHGDVSRFVGAGVKFVNPAEVPEHIYVYPHEGYDGQFSYRLALDPTELQFAQHLGIALDTPFRLQRIVYPVLGWIGAGGSFAATDEALLVVNVLGLGVLGLLAGLLARALGRPPVWGLLVAGFWGFFLTIARDLTEITAAVLVVGGALAWVRQRYVTAGLVLSLAVLSRESTVWLVVGMAVPELLALMRGAVRERRVTVTRRMLVFLIPAVAFWAWQWWCWHQIGVLPVISGGSANLSWPFVGLVPASVGWVRDLFGPKPLPSLLIVVQALALTAVVIGAARRLRRPGVDPALKGAWVGATLLVVSLSDSVWAGPADFRTAAELYLASAILLVANNPTPRVISLGVLATTAITGLVRMFVF